MHDYSRHVVAEYLQAHFPDHKIADRYDPDAKAQVFRLSKKGQRYILIVGESFFRDKTSGELSNFVQTLKVADALYRYRTAVLDERGVYEKA